MAARAVLTYADYASLPDDGRRYELHEGLLSVTPAPGTRHQRLLRDLLVVFDAHVRSRGLGEVFVSPVDCILSDDTVLQPDLAFVEAARGHIVTERGIEGAPTLVVEVLSPSTARVDRDVKTAIYARHGVPHYWIVDAEGRTIEAFSLAGPGYRPAGRLERGACAALPPFDGLTIDMSTLGA
jgi:Uma2 family endonuclease